MCCGTAEFVCRVNTLFFWIIYNRNHTIGVERGLTMHNFIFLIIVLITNAIQAITGFAGTLLAMPPAILLIGVDNAKVILNFIAFLTCLFIVLGNRKKVKWRILAKILVLMAVGMAAGIWIFRQVHLDILLYLYGGLIMVTAVRKLRNSGGKELVSVVQAVILLAAGVIHGMFVSGGALLVVYAADVLKDKEEFRATVAAVWVVLNAVLLCSQAMEHMFTPELTGFAVIACIPALAGVAVGNRLHQRIGKKAFLRVTYILLFISGVLCFI